MVDHGVAAMIRDGKIHQIPSAMQVGGNKGMKLLNQALGELVRSGTVSPEEGYIKAIDKDSYLKVLERMECPMPDFSKNAEAAAEEATSGDDEEAYEDDKPRKRGFFG